jgi:hypothetical protein
MLGVNETGGMPARAGRGINCQRGGGLRGAPERVCIPAVWRGGRGGRGCGGRCLGRKWRRSPRAAHRSGGILVRRRRRHVAARTPSWLAFWGRAIWFSLQVWQREQGAASIVKEVEVFGGPPSGFAFRRCGGEAEVVEDAADGVWVGNGGDHLEPPIAAGAF